MRPPHPAPPSNESLFRPGLNAALAHLRGRRPPRVVVNNDSAHRRLTSTPVSPSPSTPPRAVIATPWRARWTSPSASAPRADGRRDVIYLGTSGDRHALTAVTPCRMQLVMVDVDKAAAANREGPGAGNRLPIVVRLTVITCGMGAKRRVFAPIPFPLCEFHCRAPHPAAQTPDDCGIT